MPATKSEKISRETADLHLGMDIAEAVARAMQRRGVDRRKLAKRMGVPVRSLDCLLAADCLPIWDLLSRAMAALEIRLEVTAWPAEASEWDAKRSLERIVDVGWMMAGRAVRMRVPAQTEEDKGHGRAPRRARAGQLTDGQNKGALFV